MYSLRNLNWKLKTCHVKGLLPDLIKLGAHSWHILFQKYSDLKTRKHSYPWRALYLGGQQPKPLTCQDDLLCVLTWEGLRAWVFCKTVPWCGFHGVILNGITENLPAKCKGFPMAQTMLSFQEFPNLHWGYAQGIEKSSFTHRASLALLPCPCPQADPH